MKGRHHDHTAHSCPGGLQWVCGAALKYAIELARKLQARLTLLHVVSMMPMGVADGGVALPYSYIQALEAEVRHKMETYRQRMQEVGLESTVLV
jgi:nucleotide-binding universal stress UspA family protein